MVILITLIIGVIVGLLVSFVSASKNRKKIKSLEQTIGTLKLEQKAKDTPTESTVAG